MRGLRGVKRDSILTCDFCVNWSEEQWIDFDKKYERHNTQDHFSLSLDHGSEFNGVYPHIIQASLSH